MSAVLGQGSAEHWVTYPVTGSFTAPGADEALALVGNVGELDEIRWVVIGRPEGEWRLLGTSDWLVRGLGACFDPPSGPSVESARYTENSPLRHLRSTMRAGLGRLGCKRDLEDASTRRALGSPPSVLVLDL